MNNYFQFSSATATILIAGALAASAVMTVSGAQINDETAKTIAFEDAGLKEEEATLLQLTLDTENSYSIYKVEFLTKDFAEYDYEILSSDGTIMNIDYEAKLASAVTQNASATITLEQAKERALAQSGQTAEEVTFVKESFEYENGVPVYETEFHTTDQKKYKYEFNGSTGAVISWEYDAWNWLNAANLSAGSGNPPKADAISGPEAARAAALKMAKLNTSDVTWGAVKRDHEDGRLVYEGEFYYRSLKYEFELDGATGVMLDWEVESIYD